MFAACPSDAASAYLDVAVQGASDDEAMADRLVPELRAELRLRSIVLCPASQTATRQNGRRLGHLQVVFSPATASSRPVTITIDDLVTGKRSSRLIDLSAVPEKTYELTIAIAADELVRASWAELLLAGEPQEARVALPPPALETLRAQAERSTPHRPLSWNVSLQTLVERGAAERWGGALGVGAVTPRLWAGAISFGWLESAPLPGPNGQADIRTFQAQLEAGHLFPLTKSLHLAPLLLLRGQWLRIEGDARAPALEYQGNRFNADGGAALEFGANVAKSFTLFARATALYGARQITVTDGTQPVGSVGGLSWQAGAGLRWSL